MQRRKLVTLLVLFVLFGAWYFGVRPQLGLGLHPDSLRDAVAEMGVWGPLAYVGIVAFRVPLGLPSQLVLIGGGLLFGMAAGTLYGAVGILISAVVLFCGSRWAGREALEPRVPARFRPLFEVASSRLGAAFIAVGTGYPFGPITMYHLIAGVTGMAFLAFAVAAAAGSMLRAATFTYFGSSLLSGDWDALLRAGALITLALLVPLALPTPRAWLRRALGRQPEGRVASSPPE